MIELFDVFNFKTTSYIILKSGTKKYAEKHKLAYRERKNDMYYLSFLWKKEET